MSSAPRRLLIGSQTYRISRSSAALARAARTMKAADGLLGYTDTGRALILIQPQLPLAEAQTTLLHELLHAILAEAIPTMNGTQEERIVQAITPPILEVLRENPTLVSYLTK